MKTIPTFILTLFFTVLFTTNLVGLENIAIHISKYPQSVDDFLLLRDQLANTPEGGAALTIIALDAYVKNHPDALKFLTLILSQNNLQQSNSPNAYKGYEPSKNYFNYHFGRMQEKPSFMECYIINNQITFRRNQFSIINENQIKTFVLSNVSSMSPRPITMEKNDKGIWKAKELSSLFLGCPEQKKAKDDL